MQISTNIVNSGQPFQPKPSNERVERDDSRERRPEASVQPVNRIAEVDLDAEFQRRVDLSRAVAENLLTSQPDKNLPLSNQKAIEAFENNKPSIEQQLGIEIFRIDIHA